MRQLPLVLIGPMGAGKTRLGRRVARELDLPFVDTDRNIVAQHGPIPTIFDEQGEPVFREYERLAVAEALTQSAVISLGGGAVLDEDTRRDLLDHTVVFLTVTADAVLTRMDTSRRPLLNDGPEAWQRIFDERLPLYTQLATTTVDTSSGSPEDLATSIARWAKDPEMEHIHI